LWSEQPARKNGTMTSLPVMVLKKRQPAQIQTTFEPF
jgi:hypothetical protein